MENKKNSEEKINQLGNNKLKAGEVYSFDVIELKNGLIYLKLNDEIYTVSAKEKQINGKLPLNLICEVISIKDEIVLLTQKKKKDILLLLIIVFLLIIISFGYFFYQNSLNTFEEDLDSETKIEKIENPNLINEEIKYKLNGFGGSTISIKDLTKSQFHQYLKGNKNSTNNEENKNSISFSEENFNDLYTNNGIINDAGLNFKYNDALLSENSIRYLKYFVEKCIQSDKNGKFNISGFSCDIGTDFSNMELSKSRALAVQKYITDLGVAVNKTSIEYFGESKFEIIGSIEESRELNRLVIISFSVAN